MAATLLLMSSFLRLGVYPPASLFLSIQELIFLRGNRLGDSRDVIRNVCGDAVVDKCSEIWGLNAEGEINGAWRDLGVKGLWYMIGKFFRLGLLVG